MDSLRFTVNHREYVIATGSRELDGTLLDFLRTHGYTGCKRVCGEGGCGACTVIVSRWDDVRETVTHRSCVACLVPLFFVHMGQVTTVEGLAGAIDDHPVCEAFHQLGASQCGFCTPGFITTLVARLEDGDLTTAELERLFDGNLCRCTGYRPILDAAAVFCADHESVTRELGERATGWRARWEARTPLAAGFPEAYKRPAEAMRIEGQHTTWIRPVTLSDLAEDGPVGRMIAGNTDVGYTERLALRTTQTKVSLNNVRELHRIKWHEDRVEIGAAVSIHDLAAALEARIPTLPDAATSVLKALHNQCRFFANNQIRHVATIGGGVINLSHYSDLIPVWVAARAELQFLGSETPIRLAELTGPEGHLHFEPPQGQALVTITVPYSKDGERVASFKYARRRMDSITFLSACCSARCDDQNLVRNPILCFDGTGNAGWRAVRTEALLEGAVWDETLLAESLACLREEVAKHMDNGLPKPLQAYQVRLAEGILVRFHARVRQIAGGAHPLGDEPLLARYPQIAHRSILQFKEASSGILGRAIPHIHAERQTTGDAEYTADYQVANSLQAALITSPVPRGRLRGIDPGGAALSPSFVALITADDIPGKNTFGFRVEDEEVLASDEVSYVGQPIAAVVATSAEAARDLARLVHVDIEEHDAPMLTVDAAEAEGSFHGRNEGYLLEQGDLDQGFAGSAVQVEGTVDVGGQAHFYLEPHNAVAIPKDGGMELYASTQSPTNVVDHVSSILGIPDNKVTVRVGRLGGGFGGKQFRAGPIAAICALAAHKAEAPVKLVLERHQDLAFCPGRSPFRAKYRAGFGEDGRITALDVSFRVSGGATNDYSADITETATLLMDGVYRIDNVRVHGRCMRTNVGSYTATRGFGKPQASAIIETILDHGATALRKPAAEVRSKNLYTFGDKTITKMDIGDDTMRACWQRAMERSDYDALRASVDAFNRENRWLKRGLAIVGSKGNMGFLEADDLMRGIAMVQVLRDGSISVNHSGIEMGQGINTRMSQVAAHALGVPIERVEVTDTQSALLPNTPPTTMVATDLIGEALMKACAEITERLAPFEGSFKERVGQAHEADITLSATASHNAPRLFYDYEKQQGDISYFFVWGAAVSVVEIDVISGSFRILESHVVQDCGKSLNPLLDVGQAEGGFLFGVGYYMTEELIYDDKGRIITDNVSGYKLPSCGDVPLLWDIELLNHNPEGSGLHNSKGIGEANTQLGLSVYFATKEAVRAARADAGMSPEFSLGFPASVVNVCRQLPKLSRLLGEALEQAAGPMDVPPA